MLQSRRLRTRSRHIHRNELAGPTHSSDVPEHWRRRQARTLIVPLSSWRRPMKSAALTLALALTLACVADASASHAPTSAAASAAFGRLLHQRYGDVRGFWTCPIAGDVIDARTSCLAEVRAGLTWHQTSALAGLRAGRVVISKIVNTAWVRHWWPYSRHFILRSDEPQVPGDISVNSPAYDWGFLAECAGTGSGRPFHCDAYDGNGTGLFRFFLFTCTGSTAIS